MFLFIFLYRLGNYLIKTYTLFFFQNFCQEETKKEHVTNLFDRVRYIAETDVHEDWLKRIRDNLAARAPQGKVEDESAAKKAVLVDVQDGTKSSDATKDGAADKKRPSPELKDDEGSPNKKQAVVS